MAGFGALGLTWLSGVVHALLMEIEPRGPSSACGSRLPLTVGSSS